MKNIWKKWLLLLALSACLCAGCGNIDNGGDGKEKNAETQTEGLEDEEGRLAEAEAEQTGEREMTIIFLPDIGESFEFKDINKQEKLGERLKEKLLSAAAFVNAEGIWKADGTRLDEKESLVAFSYEAEKIEIIRLKDEKSFDILEQRDKENSILLAAKGWEEEDLNGEVIGTLGTREQQLFARTACQEGVSLLVGYGAGQSGGVFAVERMPVILGLGDCSGDYSGILEVKMEEGKIKFVKWIPITYKDTVLEISEGEAKKEALLQLRTQSGRYRVSVSGLICDSFWRQSETGFDINY